MGVPWGTLIVLVGVLMFYLFVQGGAARWGAPLVLPFRAWSYQYPIGVLTAGFAHASAGHLTGNLLGTVVFGALAEYALGHFPTKRGSATFSSVWTNPLARISCFIGGTIVVGVLTGLFSLGPVIGFSGVVFAYAGFALVQLPLLTLIVVVGGSVVNLVYRSLQRPTVQSASGPGFSSPWWAEVAIQGHALGLFLGLIAGVALLRHRDDLPNPVYLFAATVGFGIDRGLWAVYGILGNGRFELYRAGGLAVLFIMAGVVTAAATAQDRVLISRIDLQSREAAIGITLAVLIALSAVAVPYNVLTVGSGGELDSQESINIKDYEIYYVENVQNRLVTGLDIPGVDANVTASGVVVVSEKRNIWWTAFGKRNLAFFGSRTLHVGGIGWRDSVVANRTGWSIVGNTTTYRIRLRPADGEFQTVYYSGEVVAEPVVAGRNVSLYPTDNGFTVAVRQGNVTLGRAPVPANTTSVTIGGLELANDSGQLFAAANGTRVRVATQEKYD
jgi:membrane associated rhomboid family serine protease